MLAAAHKYLFVSMPPGRCYFIVRRAEMQSIGLRAKCLKDLSKLDGKIMDRYILRLAEDVVPGNSAPIYLPAAARSVYLVEGDTAIEFVEGAQHHGAGTAWIGEGEISLLVGAQGARLWRWELLPESRAEDDGVLRGAPSSTSVSKLSATVQLDSGFGWSMRFERVEIPRGGIAYSHAYPGPSIRCTLRGQITTEIAGESCRCGPGDASHEIGKRPIVTRTTNESEAIFVRCSLLPQACRGHNSVPYGNQTDASGQTMARCYVLGERVLKDC
jgi:hypothetical protein